MFDVIINALSAFLTAAGFTVLMPCDAPRDNELKGKFIAFLQISEARNVQTGYDFDTGRKKQAYEFDVKCRLMGKEGDCSDRRELLSRAFDAQEALIDAGYKVKLKNDMKINKALSRAECELDVTDAYILIPEGGNI